MCVCVCVWTGVDDAVATGMDRSRSRKAPRVPSATVENSSAPTASVTVRRLSHSIYRSIVMSRFVCLSVCPIA